LSMRPRWSFPPGWRTAYPEPRATLAWRSGGSVAGSREL